MKILQLVRKFVEAFQKHTCSPRCLVAKDKRKACKRGFPKQLSGNEEYIEEQNHIIYRRTKDEERNIVLNNPDIMLFAPGHHCLIHVTDAKYLSYLTKYIGKMEPSLDVTHVSGEGENSTRSPYVRVRPKLASEAAQHLLGSQQCRSSIEIEVLPTKIHADYKVLKRSSHFPGADPPESDKFYTTEFEKYLDRLEQLHDLT